VSIVNPRQYLVAGLDNGRAAGGIKLSGAEIHLCAGALDTDKGVNYLLRHQLAPDLEIIDRPLGLRSVKRIGGYFHLTHAVTFDSVIHFI
jgi:hypothetical protein